MELIPVALIVFFAMFTQSVSGFGLGLVSMSLLTYVIDPISAAALVSLVGITAEAILIIRFRQNLQLRPLLRLLISSLIGIPIGVLAISQLDSRLVLSVLAFVLIGYALYGLLNFHLPYINNPNWGYGFGFAAGLLTGAYNTGGPPFVIYGTARRWSPAEFRANLQVLFIFGSVLVVASHAIAGHFTPQVMQRYLVALPMIAAGAGVGLLLDKRINPLMFRKIVLALLLVLGIRMLLT